MWTGQWAPGPHQESVCHFVSYEKATGEKRERVDMQAERTLLEKRKRTVRRGGEEGVARGNDQRYTYIYLFIYIYTHTYKSLVCTINMH